MSEPQSNIRVNSTVDPRKIDWHNFDQLVMTARIVVVALVMGLVFFSGVILLGGVEFDWQLGSLTWIGLGCALAAIPMSSLVPSIMISAQLRTALPPGSSQESNPALFEKLFGLFMVRLIVGCAMLEGAGFFNAIVFNMEKNPLSLVATAVCIALILAKFPTKWRVQRWIAERLM